MSILLTVLPSNFLNSSGKNKHDVRGRFHPFDCFFVFNSFDDPFVQVIDRALSSYAQKMSSFIPADFLQPWRAQQRILHIRHSSDRMG
jgi:hypothetical protein